MNLPVVLAIAGSVALFVGLLGGGIKAKEIEVPKIATLPRISSGLFGLFLIGVAIWLFVSPSNPTLSPTETVSPDTSISTRNSTVEEQAQKIILTSSPALIDTPLPADFPISQTPTFSVPLAPTYQPITSGNLASVNAKAARLRFFESDNHAPPIDQRIYSNKFSKSTTRYVYWELDLRYIHPEQRYDFVIHSIYYRSDGYIFGELDDDSIVLPTWTESYYYRGWGWDDTGKWDKDTYTVILYIDNAELARASFTIQ